MGAGVLSRSKRSPSSTLAVQVSKRGGGIVDKMTKRDRVLEEAVYWIRVWSAKGP